MVDIYQFGLAKLQLKLAGLQFDQYLFEFVIYYSRLDLENLMESVHFIRCLILSLSSSSSMN